MKSKRFVSKMDTLDDMLSCIHRSLYYIKAVCCNKQFKVMIDSGAQTSIMSYHMMQQLQLQHGLDKTHKGYATGVGKAKIHGVIKHCDVNVDNIVITTNFKVMDTDTMDDTTKYLVIFGLDVLETYNCIINFKTKTLTVGSYVIRFLNEGEIDQLTVPQNVDVLQLQQYIDHMNDQSKQLIKKIVNNILTHPTDDKYKSINITNQQVQKHLLSHATCMDLLRHLGFYESHDKLMYSPSHHHLLEQVNDIVAY